MSEHDIILELRGISKSFPGVKALDDVSLQIRRMDGEIAQIRNPIDSQNLGVSVVFQELTVFPDLTVLENIFMNRELTKHGLYNWKAMRKRTQEIIDELAERGAGIIVVSSEEQELIGICDRIVAMHEGHLTGEIADVPNTPDVERQLMVYMMNADNAQSAS